MAKLATKLAALRAEWETIPAADRKVILQASSSAVGNLKAALKLIPPAFRERAMKVAFAEVPRLLMLAQFGGDIEGLLAEVSQAFPEISAYTRQLFGN